MIIKRDCLCGKRLLVNVSRDKQAQVLGNWYEQHDGPGHGDATAAIAEQARTGSGQPDGREARRAK